MAIALCDGISGAPLPVAESVLQLRVGSDALSYRRGALVGNVAFWLLLAVLLALLAYLRSRGCARDSGTTLWAAAGELHLPGLLLFMYLPLLQPTVTSSVTLMVQPSSSPTARDVVLGLLGLAVCVAPIPCLAAVVAQRGPFPAVAHVEAVTDSSEARCAGRLRSLSLRAALSRRARWRDRISGSGFVSHYGATFDAYGGGRQWFIVVDLCTEAVAGVCGALVYVPQQQGSRCAALKIAMVAVSVLYLAAVAVLRPANTALDAFVTASNASVADQSRTARKHGATFALAQGVVASATSVASLAAVVYSGRLARAMRHVRHALCGGQEPPPLHPSDSEAAEPPLLLAAEPGECNGVDEVDLQPQQDDDSKRSVCVDPAPPSAESGDDDDVAHYERSYLETLLPRVVPAAAAEDAPVAENDLLRTVKHGFSQQLHDDLASLLQRSVA